MKTSCLCPSTKICITAVPVIEPYLVRKGANVICTSGSLTSGPPYAPNIGVPEYQTKKRNSCMSFTQKDLIIAYREEGLSYQEIAEKTHTSEEYCRTIWSRANRRHTGNPADSVNKNCRYCGKQLALIPGAKGKHFCSDECRTRFHNQQKKRKCYLRVCEQCGNEFVAFGNKKKRFCSRECQTAASRKE